MIHNYFADLELDIQADLNEVQRAYRRLAKKFHPDINSDPKAPAAFRLIQEAYATLNTEGKILKHKKQIEVQISQIKFAEKKVTYALTPVKREEFIEISGIYRPKNRLIKTDENLDIHLVLSIDADDLEKEGSQFFEFPFRKPCSVCLGSGANPQSRKQTCKICKGLGVSKIQRGAMKWDKTCEACDGKGVTAEKCNKCLGTGIATDRQQIEFKITKKLDFTKPIEFKGLGNYAETGKRRGSVWVQLMVRD
ncbi:MAG: DnaJ domain-containing protein [Deltaproteobacteria bacterium]|nr:DnaJ domain-containing protein [Deltaproteobacteria bacterium]